MSADNSGEPFDPYAPENKHRLPERLRHASDLAQGDCDFGLYIEAADEIERLRAYVDEWAAEIKHRSTASIDDTLLPDIIERNERRD